jgi:hypothetical protein
MTIYEADFDNIEGKILLKKDNNIKKINVSNLLLNDGNNVPDNSQNSIDRFEKNQQQINYLDSIKDGTNVFLLQGLDIYPKSDNLEYTNLKVFEHNILNARESYLTHTTWLKVKKGSVLDPGKEYQECFWESGLGYQTFLAYPDDVITIKTFGSYIDPLEKQNAKQVWPPIGSKIQLKEKFMKLMGFGEYSSVEAITKSNTDFEYTLNIGCGQTCRDKKSNCYLTHTRDDEGSKSDFYFAGNNVKNQFIKTNATTKQKVKFIVVKEWGDKTQVLIYLLYCNYLTSNNNVIMTTCDLVVFMLCLNLSIPCIYTGAYNPPGQKLQEGKKYYSILEYKPSNEPFKDAVRRLSKKLSGILEENDSFITSVKKLVENPDTSIRVGDKDYVFKKEFYEAIFTDIKEKQKNFEDEKEKLLNKYKNYTEITGKDKIGEIERDIKIIQMNFIIVPFLKIKKGTKNTITILMTKSYTAQKPVDNIKPNIVKLLNQMNVDGVKESKKSFLELALKYFTNSSTGGGKKYKQKGGALSAADIEKIFAVDEDNYESYTYIKDKEVENVSEIYNVDNNDAPLFNPNFDNSVEKYSLLEKLSKSFDQTLKNSKYKTSVYFENFYDTVYTLFVYESYLNGVANDHFSNDDLERIVTDYESEHEENINQYMDIAINKNINQYMDIAINKNINQNVAKGKRIFSEFEDEYNYVPEYLQLKTQRVSVYGGKRKKTIKKSKLKKFKKTRNNKKMIKLKTKKYGKRKQKFSIKKLK